jgi:cell pole-organizing protein PopZ
MMHGFMPIKTMLQRIHVNGAARNKDILRAVMTAHNVESHSGPKGIRLWYRTSAAKPYLAEVVEKIKAEAKRPNAVGVAMPRKHKEKHRKAATKVNGAGVMVRPIGPPSDKGMLIALPQGQNKTLLFTLEEARNIYKWLGKLFAGE